MKKESNHASDITLIILLLFIVAFGFFASAVEKSFDSISQKIDVLSCATGKDNK